MHVIIKDKKFLSVVLHDVLTQMRYKVGNGDSLAVRIMSGDGEFVYPLV